ncbi:MAG: hypothetical protein M3Q49_08595 [Actinomycetota bacterium]|nr:hypothetical protein [Actinomycetota bacterium]
MADVPGISYSGSSTADRAKPDGHDLAPEVQQFDFDGEVRRSLYWPSVGGGSTSASPVHQRTFNKNRDTLSAHAELRRLEETLELPGELSDYHFAIQGTLKTVFDERRQDCALVEEIERLCWLDIVLIEAHPEVAEYEPGRFFHVMGYELLMRLYEGEGYFAEALEVAESAAHLGQEHSLARVKRLRTRLAELEAEDEPR